jgi:predicted PurR-regulated permease PerM
MQIAIEQLPEAAGKSTTSLAHLPIGEFGSIEKMPSAANEVERATTQAATGSAEPRPPATHFIAGAPAFWLSSQMWKSFLGVPGVLLQGVTDLFLVVFLLLGGDTIRRKLMRLTGPSLSKCKVAIRILDDINSSTRKYMLMLLSINVPVALLRRAVFR